MGEKVAILSSKNMQMSKNGRSEDVSMLLPRVCSILCCCQESDDSGMRLTAVAKTTVMA